MGESASRRQRKEPPQRTPQMDLIGGLQSFSKRFPQVGVALSLNAADDETRVQVMPVNDKFPMKVLRETLEEMERIRESGVMIEYIMFRGVNDSLEDAKKVAMK